jgi:hypothetical protein
MNWPQTSSCQDWKKAGSTNLSRTWYAINPTASPRANKSVLPPEGLVFPGSAKVDLLYVAGRK